MQFTIKFNASRRTEKDVIRFMEMYGGGYVSPHVHLTGAPFLRYLICQGLSDFLEKNPGAFPNFVREPPPLPTNTGGGYGHPTLDAHAGMQAVSTPTPPPKRRPLSELEPNSPEWLAETDRIAREVMERGQNA